MNNKKEVFVKDVLGSRKKYHEIINDHSFTDNEKDILLQASVNIHKSKTNKILIDKAYDILISKSIESTIKNKSSTMDFSILKYLLIGAFLFMVFYLTTFNDPEKAKKAEESKQMNEIGHIVGQGFLKTKGGLVRTCSGNKVYLEEYNENSFAKLQYGLLQKNKDFKKLKNFFEMIEYGYLHNPNPTSKNKKYVTDIKDKLSKLEQEIFDDNKKINRQRDNVFESICDAQGNFEFKKVKLGQYTISTVVQWYVGDEKQGGFIEKIFIVKDGKNRFMITE